MSVYGIGIKPTFRLQRSYGTVCLAFSPRHTPKHISNRAPGPEGLSRMDAQRQRTLWAIAQENYQAARLTAQRGWHNVSVACSYYAVFTAMWVALGEPPNTTTSVMVAWSDNQ